jgi:pSer/pThr/pTyr-binding forkhead associated (FHA) protein
MSGVGLKLKIKVLRGADAPTEKEFEQESIVIGRSPDCDFVLSDSGVSRKHCELLLASDGVMIRKLSSNNFLLVDGEDVSEAWVRHPAKIQLGETELGLESSVLKEKKPSLKAGALVTLKSEPVQGPNEQALVARNLSLANQDKSVLASRDSKLLTPNASKKLPGFSSGPDHLSQNPFSDPRAANSFESSLKSKQKTNPLFFVVAVILALGVLYYLFFDSSSSKSKKAALKLRTQVVATQNIAEAEKQNEQTQEELKPKKTVQYEKAQEQFIKGFRDYRSGNYLRALEAFAAALAFDPSHEQAKRYYALASRRQQEFIQGHFQAGKRYYGVKNYRLCESHLAIVLRSIKDQNDPTRQEALQYWRECKSRVELAY